MYPAIYYEVPSYDDELYHHGVKGMRWGVRRYQNYDGTLKAAGKRRKQENGGQGDDGARRLALTDKQKKNLKTAAKIAGGAALAGAVAYGAYKLGKHNAGMSDETRRMFKDAIKQRRTMSSDELKARIEHIKLERELKNLTEEELVPGSALAKEILATAGKRAATTMAAGAMLYGAKVAMTKAADRRDAAAYITPRPKNK